MTFDDAIIIANERAKMIGSFRNGARLDEIIIAPTNPGELNAFKLNYISTLNAKTSILPYINSDVSVCGVYDKHRIRLENCLIITEL